MKTNKFWSAHWNENAPSRRNPPPKRSEFDAGELPAISRRPASRSGLRLGATLSGLRITGLLGRRAKDGSLLSVRIPVTAANRRLLRALRLAEFEAWQEAS